MNVIPQSYDMIDALRTEAQKVEASGGDSGLLVEAHGQIALLAKYLFDANAEINRLQNLVSKSYDALEASEGYIQPVVFAQDEGAKLAIKLRNEAMTAIEDGDKISEIKLAA